MLKKICLLGIYTFSIYIYADSIDYEIALATVKKSFLIIKSTSNYNKAKQYAKKIAKTSHIKLDFKGLQFNKKIYLTQDKKTCKEYGYPCYFPRGRYDDGEYISIEHSNSYKHLKNGYYIVIAASGNKLDSSLEKIKKVVPDAYIKSDKVYMGCMH